MSDNPTDCNIEMLLRQLQILRTFLWQLREEHPNLSPKICTTLAEVDKQRP